MISPRSAPTAHMALHALLTLPLASNRSLIALVLSMAPRMVRNQRVSCFPHAMELWVAHFKLYISTRGRFLYGTMELMTMQFCIAVNVFILHGEWRARLL